MTSNLKTRECGRRGLAFLLILLIFPIVSCALTQKFNFTMQNNTALDFENGTYIIEIIEVSPPYVKINISSYDRSVIETLFDREDAISYNQMKLASSSITSNSAVINIEFPSEWSYPRKYLIEKPVPLIGIPEIRLTKTADRTSVFVGDIVEFKIKVENTGNATAYNLTLEEQLPAGFSSAPGSRFPPSINPELEAGGSQEIYYALKAVEPGIYRIEPSEVKYGARTNESGEITITVAEPEMRKSNLNTVISIDNFRVETGDPIKATVKITNNGTSSARSVLIDGTLPLDMEIIEGDLRQVYDIINPDEIKEYRITLKAKEAGNYTIHLRTVYNDAVNGVPSDSPPIIVTEKDKRYWYIFVSVIGIAIAMVLFIVKRHREYSY